MSTIAKSNIDFSLPYKVKDISLAEWGRKEIRLAEAEMPGLMSLRKELGYMRGKDRRWKRLTGVLNKHYSLVAPTAR